MTGGCAEIFQEHSHEPLICSQTLLVAVPQFQAATVTDSRRGQSQITGGKVTDYRRGQSQITGGNSPRLQAGTVTAYIEQGTWERGREIDYSTILIGQDPGHPSVLERSSLPTDRVGMPSRSTGV